MSNSAGGKSQRKSVEILAGEYVLGILPIEQHKTLEERLRNDAQFAAVVERWSRNLKRVEMEERANSQAIYDSIYGEPNLWQTQKLGLSQRLLSRLAGLWRSLFFWRTATVMFVFYSLVSQLS